jgi:hypothetical protein
MDEGSGHQHVVKPEVIPEIGITLAVLPGEISRPGVKRLFHVAVQVRRDLVVDVFQVRRDGGRQLCCQQRFNPAFVEGTDYGDPLQRPDVSDPV